VCQDFQKIDSLESQSKDHGNASGLDYLFVGITIFELLRMQGEKKTAPEFHITCIPKDEDL
jgi:hypothetical protein